MNKHVLFGLITFFILSCSNRDGTNEQQNPGEQTPELLNDDRKLAISSYGKRFGSDIIQELFEEAIDKDEALETVTSRLEEVKELKSDSLEAYQTYMSNNQNYWTALNRYSNQLSDSTVKKQLTKLIETLKNKQEERVDPLNSLIADIDSTEQTLGDLEILMKIIVTEPMMNNYQRNEYPRIKALESVKQAMDSSINQVKPYTKIQK